MTNPDLDRDHLRNTPLGVLVNTHCGHIAGICNLTDQRMITHLNRIRTAANTAGRHGFRVETRPVTDTELEHLIRGTRCDRCRLD